MVGWVRAASVLDVFHHPSGEYGCVPGAMDDHKKAVPNVFQQCLENGIMPFIVLDSAKAFYYRGLSEYEQQPGFLREAFRSLQDDYYARFARFVEMTPGE